MGTTERNTRDAAWEHERTQAVPLARYAGVWVALTALTALTYGVSRVDLGAWNIVIALVIALVKSTLVALFFMHLWESTGAIPLVLATTLVLLSVLIALSISDATERFVFTTPQPELEHGAVK